MRYLLGCISIGVFLFASLGNAALPVSGKTHYKKGPLKPTEVVFTYPFKLDNTPLRDAIALHNFANHLYSYRRFAEDFKLSVQNLAVDKALVADFDACEENLLKNYFADPADVWKKIKAEAEVKAIEYSENAVYEAEQLKDKLSSESVEPTEVENNQDSDSSSDERYDHNWNIGYLILHKLYASQDIYGARKTLQTSSLPLWNDQKYLYENQVWKPKYEGIVAYCQKQNINLANKEPNLSQKEKYDYYFYDKIKKAHENFILSAVSQGCVLPPKMKEPPVQAPYPLPPVQEVLKVSLTGTGLFDGLYPQVPMNVDKSMQTIKFVDGSLWAAYKNDNFVNVAQKGEFSTYFNVDNGVLTPTKNVQNLKQNRISKYFALKRNLETSQQMYENMLEMREKLKQGITEPFNKVKVPALGIIEKYGLSLPDGFDVFDLDSLEKLKEISLKQRDVKLQEYKKQLEEREKSPNKKPLSVREELDMLFVKALEKDKNAELSLNKRNVETFDDSLKEAQAERELSNRLKKQYLNMRENQLKEKNKKADRALCLDPQTDTTLVDLDHVKIE